MKGNKIENKIYSEEFAGILTKLEIKDDDYHSEFRKKKLIGFLDSFDKMDSLEEGQRILNDLYCHDRIKFIEFLEQKITHEQIKNSYFYLKNQKDSSNSAIIGLLCERIGDVENFKWPNENYEKLETNIGYINRKLKNKKSKIKATKLNLKIIIYKLHRKISYIKSKRKYLKSCEKDRDFIFIDDIIGTGDTMRKAITLYREFHTGEIIIFCDTIFDSTYNKVLSEFEGIKINYMNCMKPYEFKNTKVKEVENNINKKKNINYYLAMNYTYKFLSPNNNLSILYYKNNFIKPLLYRNQKIYHRELNKFIQKNNYSDNPPIKTNKHKFNLKK